MAVSQSQTRSQYVISLNARDISLYFEKLKDLGFPREEDDPFLVDEANTEETAKDWCAPVETWPSLEFGSVYIYLSDDPDYTSETLKAYKTLNAYQYVVNGWVHHIAIRHSSSGHCIIRSRVNGSEDGSVEPYTVWIGMNTEDGSITCGCCTCMSRTSPICIHIAALVFQVETAAREGYTEKPCSCCPLKESIDKQSVHEDGSVCDNDNEDLDTMPSSQGDGMMAKVDEVVTSQSVVKAEQGANDVFPCTMCALTFCSDLALEYHVKGEHYEIYQKFLKQGGKTVLANMGLLNEMAAGMSKLPSSSPLPEGQAENEPNGEDLLELEGSPQERAMLSPEALRKRISIRNRRAAKEKRFKCEICGKAFIFNSYLRTHMMTHTGEKPCKCEICGKGFRKNSDVLIHMMTHTGEKPHKCDECDKSYRKLSDLRNHKKLHTGEKLVECQECGKFFLDNSSLRVHMRSHTGEKPYECPECGKRFGAASSFYGHMKRHAGLKPYTCNECGSSFTESGHLHTHMRIHTGEKPFHCTECGRDFARSTTLRTHMKTHAMKKSFVCHECGKGFGQVGYLREHMKTHTGDLPFSCDECGKGFTRQGNLTRHAKIHSGERPYACSECGKGFCQKSTLLSHMRVHTGEKPFECGVCGKSFNQGGALRTHMRTHTGERPFKCEDCGESFTYNGALLSHMQVHAGDVPLPSCSCHPEVQTMLCKNNLCVKAS